MLEKPFILSLLLTIFSFLLSIPLSVIYEILSPKGVSSLSSILSVMIISFLIGMLHARKYARKFSLQERLKIVLYYFMLNFPFFLSIILLLTANTTVKGMPPYSIFVIILIFDILYMFLTISFFTYFLLDIGCITWLKYKKIELLKDDDDRFSVLLQKPIFLSLILLFITYFINSIIPISSMFVKDLFAPIKLCFAVFLAAMCIGLIIDKIQTVDKLKIALYTFLLYNVYITSLLLISGGKAVINSIVFFDQTPLLQISKIFILNLVAAASIYLGIGVGKESKEIIKCNK